MPSLHKLPRRVGLLVKKRTLRRPGGVKKKAKNPIYEKLKSNNIALARALSKEKQECQCLYTQNIKLIGQVQELRASLNKSNEIILQMRKNSSESLKLLVQTSEYVTNNIVLSSQSLKTQSVSSTVSNGQSPLNVSKRDSLKRSPGKSPARGVVQPMVSGHTITKPVINLSRINMQRIVGSPNMSDIEESSESPRPSINHNQTTTTPDRNIEEQRRSGERRRMSRRAAQLPERIRRYSPPEITDDEEEEEEEAQTVLASPSTSTLSESIPSRRITDSRKRKSATVTSSSNTTLTTNHENLSERLDNSFNNSSFNLNKSPRVSLQDVGVLMQNSQSLNVRELLENDSNDTTTTTPPSSSSINREEYSPIRNFTQCIRRQKKINALKESNSPEYLGDSSPTYGLTQSIKKKKKSNNNNNNAREDPLEGPSWLLNDSEMITSPQELPRMDNSCSSDSDVTENIQMLPLSRFTMVTTERGQPMDDDDFTMVINPPPRRQQQRYDRPLDNDSEELRLPEFEAFIDPNVNVEPEPEITSTIRIVPQQNVRNSLMHSTNMFNHSLDNSMTVPIAPVPNNYDEEDDEDVSEVISKNYMKRGAVHSLVESSSESETSSPLSKVQKTKVKRKTIKRKDPSSAKVVLEKLSNVGGTAAASGNRSLSPDPRRSSYNFSRMTMASTEPRDPGSDSDSSNASNNSKTSSRPRRQKAPVNLKEPNNRTKLRR